MTSIPIAFALLLESPNTSAMNDTLTALVSRRLHLHTVGRQYKIHFARCMMCRRRSGWCACGSPARPTNVGLQMRWAIRLNKGKPSPLQPPVATLGPCRYTQRFICPSASSPYFFFSCTSSFLVRHSLGGTTYRGRELRN